MTNANHPAPTNPVTLAALGQKIILDTLRAEMAALQVILPSVAASQPPAQDAGSASDAFDNMPL